MASLKLVVALSIFLGCCILVVNVRPSFAMPIEGDRSSDNFKGVNYFINQQLQNLSDGNDLNVRRSHVPMGMSDNFTAGDTNLFNKTTISSRNSNSSLVSQQSELNNRLPFIPTVSGYARNTLVTDTAAGTLTKGYRNSPEGNHPSAKEQAWNQMTRNPLSWKQSVRNHAVANLSMGISMAGNRFPDNPPAATSLTGKQPAAARQSLPVWRQYADNHRILNNSTVGNGFPSNHSKTNSLLEDNPSTVALSSPYQMAGNQPLWKQNGKNHAILNNLTTRNRFVGSPSTTYSHSLQYQMEKNHPAREPNAEKHGATKFSMADSMAGNRFLAKPSTTNAISGKHPTAATQLLWNHVAGNTHIGKPSAGNRAAANLSLANSTTGNRFPGNRSVINSLSANKPAEATKSMRNQMAGNNLSWKQNAIDQTVENLSVGKSTAESRFPTNHSATNAMAGKLPLTNSVTSSQKTGNILMGNGQLSSELSINPKAQRNRVEQNWPVVTGSQAGSSQVRGNLASAQSASSLIPPSPSNPGRDQGSMYRQPTSYDRKSSIYAQSSPSYGKPAKFNYSAENVKKSDIFTPYQNRPWYQYYPQMGNTPSFQPQHTGYPDFAHPKLDYVHDKVPLRRKFKQHKASKKSRIKSSNAALSKSNTIQIKLPDKHSTVNIAPPSKSLSVDDTAAEELASVSGSGFEFTGGLQDTADDPDDSDDLDESGSGDDNGYLNPGLLGGASDIAFMLADAKKRPPVFPAPGLPMNLTRQQAIDIYKSAMYFAGLMGSDIIDGDSEESGDDDDDMDDVDNDDDEKSDHSFTDEEDNDVTITDNDIKEALDASSGELDASGRETSDVDSSGSQSEAPISKSQNKVDANPKDESKSSKTENAAQKKASQPPNEKSDSTTRKEESDSEPPQEGNKAQIEQSQPQEKAVSSQMPPPADRKTSQLSNNKQSSDTDEEDDDDTPPPDETLMKAAQANYAADQQAERAMYYLSHPRQNGAHPSAARRTIICQGTTQKISCPPDKKLRILNADYGDTGDAGCLREVNPEPSGPCRTPGAFEVVRRECEGYEDCELPASNEVFGDACPDANKYLDVNYDCVNNPVAPAVAAYRQAAPQYANPPPVSYAPAPYQAPPRAAYGGLPNLLPPVPYAAPDPCNPCNTCAQCALPVCSPCGSTCQILTCGPQIPAKLQPLWQQFNERTADMSRMEMAALIISPLPKLSPTKAPESSESSSGAAEGSESGEPTMDEEALYEASKKSKIQRIKPQKKSKKTSLTPAKKKADKKNDSDQGFVRNNDSTISSGDTSSGSST